MFNKELGLLCHISSLYSEYGVGDLGEVSRKFIDFLAKDGYTLWEVLPLNKIDKSNCPYSSPALMAQEELYIDLIPFVEEGVLTQEEVDVLKVSHDSEHVDFDKVRQIKYDLLDKVFSRKGEAAINEGKQYLSNNPYIKDYAFYRVFTNKFGNDDWTQWPHFIKKRDPYMLESMEKENEVEMAKYGFFQSIFNKQFKKLQEYARSNNVKIMGDCAIYPSPNSVDVWVNQGIFKLDDNGLPAVNGGTFDQNWGTCVYRWQDKKEEVFNWWINRIKNDLNLYDTLRIDHYTGLCNHYEIPAGRAPHEGYWTDGGGVEFFERLFSQIDKNRIVVEDMGVMSNDAYEVRNRFDLKGMAVSQFAFEGDPDHIYLPHKVRKNTMYYIGTHDHNTLVGFLDNADGRIIGNIHRYFWLQHHATNSELALRMLKSMLHSNADTVIFQLQDVLLQDNNYVMNRVGQSGQWSYRAPRAYETFAIHPKNLQYMFYTKPESSAEKIGKEKGIAEKLNNGERIL